MVILENFASKLQAILPETGIELVIITTLGEMFGPVKGKVVNFVVRRIRKLVPSYDVDEIKGYVSYKAVMAQGKFFKVE